MKREYKEEAASVAESIRQLASKPENLDNFECYLSMHFGEWLKRFASDPENIACELKQFAQMDI